MPLPVTHPPIRLPTPRSYIYLLDSRGRVRWRGSGTPSPKELQQLLKCGEELLGQQEKERAAGAAAADSGSNGGGNGGSSSEAGEAGGGSGSGGAQGGTSQ